MMMKSISAFALAAAIACAPAAFANDESTGVDPALDALHARLTVASDLAFSCEESLHRLGKKALDAEGCNRFITQFIESWGDRETLQRTVQSFTRAVEHGRMPCNARCVEILHRTETLRVNVTYVLDYAQFTAEQ